MYYRPGFFTFMPFLQIIVLILILEVILKGVALYRAARSGHKGWFIFILVLNTLGILPIIYLLTHRVKRQK